MRNFVPALEENLMKFTADDITRPMPETKYTAHGGWFGVESFGGSSTDKRSTKKRIIKGARA